MNLVKEKKRGGCPQVRRLIRIGRTESQFLYAIKISEKTTFENLAINFQMYPSSTKRIIHALERKEKILITGNFIQPKEVQSMEFKDEESLSEFYEYLSVTKLFPRVDTGIKICTSFLYYHLLNEELANNESLNKVKGENFTRYKQIISGLVEQLNYQVKNIKRKVAGWSDGKYEIFIGVYKIYLIKTKSQEPVIFKNNFSDLKKSIILAECIFMLRKSLQEIQEKLLNLKSLDYQNL